MSENSGPRLDRRDAACVPSVGRVLMVLVEVAIGVHARPGAASSGPDPDAARFSSIVDLLMSVGHVDGYFDPRARAFILQYVDSIVLMREQSSMEPADVRTKHSAAWRAHFAELDKELTAELEVLGQEAREGKLPDRLRGRIVALFRGLTWNDLATALELIHGLLHTDGSFTPAELRLYDELRAAFVAVSAAPAAASAKKAGPAPMIVKTPEWKGLVGVSHPLLDPLEQTYSPHPNERKAQVDWDYHLIQQAMMQWHKQRTAGANRLTGIQKIDQLPRSDEAYRLSFRGEVGHVGKLVAHDLARAVAGRIVHHRDFNRAVLQRPRQRSQTRANLVARFVGHDND